MGYDSIWILYVRKQFLIYSPHSTHLKIIRMTVTSSGDFPINCVEYAGGTPESTRADILLIFDHDP